jgi:hypothetical protein
MHLKIEYAISLFTTWFTWAIFVFIHIKIIFEEIIFENLNGIKLALNMIKWQWWSFFLRGEGPRSRCYGRTTALRLFVQPYDKDDIDEQFFTKFYK